MPSTPRILVAAASVAATLAFAAPASAATVVTSPCIGVASGTTNTLPVAGGGYTPGATVTLRYASTIAPTPSFLGTAIVDAAGNFAAAPTPPLFNKFDTQDQTFFLSATDGVNAGIVAVTKFRQVRVGYLTTPPTGKPTRSARHTVRGFPPGKNVYLHFRFGGQTKRNVLVGKASSPCGIVSKRMRLLPTRSRPGRWTVYVDQSKTYKRATRPQLKYTFTITRTFS
jgi:hypothetical protein